MTITFQLNSALRFGCEMGRGVLAFNHSFLLVVLLDILYVLGMHWII